MKTFCVFFWQHGKIIKRIVEAETKEEAVKQYEPVAESDIVAVELTYY